MKTTLAFKLPTVPPRYFSEFWACEYHLLDISRKNRSISGLLDFYGSVCALLQKYRDHGCYMYRLQRALSVYYSIRYFFLRFSRFGFEGAL